MNHRYLKTIAQSYSEDTLLENDVSTEQIYTELLSIFEELKITNPLLYTYLHESSTKYQQEICYYLLDDIYEVSNLDFDIKQNLGLLEEGVMTSLAAAVAIMGPVNFLIITFVIGMAISMVFKGTYMYSPFVKLVTAFHTLGKSIYEVLFNNQTVKEAKVTEAILYNRITKCSQKCGVQSIKDLGSFAPVALHDGIFSASERDRIECLINCYLEFHINSIALLATQYRQCIQETGGTTHDMSSLLAIQQLPFNAHCEKYNKLIKKYVQTFRETIDVLYKDNHKEYGKWVKLMNDKLALANKTNNFGKIINHNVKQIEQKSRFNQSYQKPRNTNTSRFNQSYQKPRNTNTSR